MKPTKSILLAINDAIIALDVEDIIQSHFDYTIAKFTMLEAEQQLDIISPHIAIVDCDINYPNLHNLLNEIDERGIYKICFCTSKEQSKSLENDTTKILLKPFDIDELKNIIASITYPQSKLAAEEIASGP